MPLFRAHPLRLRGGKGASKRATAGGWWRRRVAELVLANLDVRAEADAKRARPLGALRAVAAILSSYRCSERGSARLRAFPSSPTWARGCGTLRRRLLNTSNSLA